MFLTVIRGYFRRLKAAAAPCHRGTERSKRFPARNASVAVGTQGVSFPTAGISRAAALKLVAGNSPTAMHPSFYAYLGNYGPELISSIVPLTYLHSTVFSCYSSTFTSIVGIYYASVIEWRRLWRSFYPRVPAFCFNSIVSESASACKFAELTNVCAVEI